MLRKARIILSVVIFGLITFYFLDFAEILPNSFHRLAHIQFVPALMSLSFIILAVLILITLLLGRIYCSTICPMGIFQDIVTWISKKTAKKKPFRLPWVKRCATFAVSYLQRRGVHSDIIRRCMQLGLFYESRYNNEAVCVFVGRDDTGTGRFACVRGIAGDLKKDISGSDKRFSFCYPPDQPGSRHLAVFEAPIDALSHATLQKLEGWQWNGYRLSLGGTSPVALVAFLERHPEITRVALYLDNDLAGRVNARKIKLLLKSDQRFSKIRVSVNPPRSGKDYNEKLQRTLQTIREEKHASRQKQAAVSI